MSDTRHRIVSAVRDGLRRAVLPDATPAPAKPAVETSLAPMGGESLTNTFTTALEALKGTVHRATTPAAALTAVAAIAAEHGVSSYLGWDEDAIGCPGLIAALASHGVRREPYDLAVTGAARERQLLALGTVPLGITGADAALADCGALVLINGPGRGRLCSLLPPVHVAIVAVGRLAPDLAAFLASRPGVLDEASNLVVIAGPSRTADIEMTLTHGVHGPRHVHVVLMG